MAVSKYTLSELNEMDNGEIFSQICHVVSKMPANGPPRLFFGSMDDSIQTEFERQSNHLKLAVVADFTKAGLTMLALLRIIIDENYDLIKMDTEMTGGLSFSFDDLARIIGDREKIYMHEEMWKSFYYTTLSGADGTINIKRSFSDIDLWTLKRLSDVGNAIDLE